MTLTLRPYQVQLLNDARKALSHHKRVVVQLSTGGGKTLTSGAMLVGAANKGLRSWFVVHRRELLEQTSATLDRVGLEHGFCAAGFPPRYKQPVTLCSVQTLGSRMERLPKPDMIILDEAHHAPAGTWKRVIDQFPDAFLIGLTATPQRLDGRGLDKMFRALVQGPSMAWLIEQGFLAPYRVWSHSPPDMSAVTDRGADFDPSALAGVMDEPHILGDAVQHYQQICPQARAIAFCVSVDHAMHTRDAFRRAGIVAEELDGAADVRHRKEIMRAFRRGEIKVLTSVDLFGEGLDVSELDAVILLRPTKSLGLYLQQCGRVLRPVYAPGSDLSTQSGRLSGIANGQKNCLARDTQILTDRGLVPIQDVRLSDKVWDGEQWVSHEGAICNGVQNVISYAGLTLTPDHLVWTQEGWKEARECARKQIPIAQTGLGRRPVRLGDNLFSGCEVGREAGKSKAARLHALRVMCRRALDLVLEFAAGADVRVPQLQSANTFSEMDLCAGAGGGAALLQPTPRRVQGLRRARHHVRLPEPGGYGAMGAGASGNSSGPRLRRDRQDRQRARICAGQPAVVITNSKSGACAPGGYPANDASVSATVSGGEVRGPDASQISSQGDDLRADRSSILESPQHEAQREVWDLVNAGRFHRFTANGLLVHNCAVILDHAGNVARHGLPDQEREWSLAGRKRRKGGNAPVKTCLNCFGGCPTGATVCMHCGSPFELTKREIDERDGALVEIDLEMARRQARTEVKQARTREQLEAIAAQRGYKRAWVEHILAARNGGSRRAG